MTTTKLPPSAGLGAGPLAGAGLFPAPPTVADLGAGQFPVPPFAPGQATPGAAGPVPWEGIQPPWLHAGGEQALLAQALRRTRSRVVQPADPRAAPAAPGRVAPGEDAQPALWRWQRPYRLLAVQAELLGRLPVQGRTLWWVNAPGAVRVGVATVQAQRLFTLQSPGPGFDHSLQLDKVLRAAVEREERLPEILSQASDLSPFFAAVSGVELAQAPHLSELLDVAWDIATHVLMALKNEVAEWRPWQRSTQVVPLIATPGHGSLPSGHATMATVAAELLARLLFPAGGERALQLDRLARRIAFNRVVAGVHFPMDSAVGYALGRQIVAALQAAALGTALPADVTFVVQEDSELLEANDPEERSRRATAAAGGKAKPSKAAAPAAPLLALLWTAARNEVAALRPYGA